MYARIGGIAISLDWETAGWARAAEGVTAVTMPAAAPAIANIFLLVRMNSSPITLSGPLKSGASRCAAAHAGGVPRRASSEGSGRSDVHVARIHGQRVVVPVAAGVVVVVLQHTLDCEEPALAAADLGPVEAGHLHIELDHSEGVEEVPGEQRDHLRRGAGAGVAWVEYGSDVGVAQSRRRRV